MSRNLCKTNCDACPAPFVALEETPRPIRKEEAGVYFDEFQGMLVANATCPACEAQYLAWVDERPRKPIRLPGGSMYFPERFVDPEFDSLPYVDLSYRSSFNDEPGGVDDLPKYEVEYVFVRVGTKNWGK